MAGEVARTPILSRREREVLERLSLGIIDKEVGQELGIALGTVRVYRKRIQAKLGVRGLVQCVLVAWQLGEIDLEAIARKTMSLRFQLPPEQLAASIDDSDEG